MKEEVLKGYAQTQQPGGGVKRYLRLWQVAAAGRDLRALAGRSRSPSLLPPIVWDNPHRAAFFFGEPVKMFKVIWAWFCRAARSTSTCG